MWPRGETPTDPSGPSPRGRTVKGLSRDEFMTGTDHLIPICSRSQVAHRARVNGDVHESRGLHLRFELWRLKERQGRTMHVPADPTPEKAGHSRVGQFGQHETS